MAGGYHAAINFDRGNLASDAAQSDQRVARIAKGPANTDPSHFSLPVGLADLCRERYAKVLHPSTGVLSLFPLGQLAFIS